MQKPETKSPPGPKNGISLTEAQEMQNDTLGFVMKAAAQYGDIMRYRIGFWDVYFLNHPDYIQHVLLDNWKNYGRQTFQFKKFALVTGDGLLNTHGERWQKHRRLMQPSFHQKKLGGMAEAMWSAVGRLGDRWDRLLVENGGTAEIEVDSHMLRLALEIVGQALFSLDLTAEADHLSQEMLEMMTYIVYRSQNLLALPAIVPTPRNNRFRRTLNKLNRRIQEMIAARRQAGEAVHDDLLDLLVFSQDATGQGLSDVEIRDEVMTLMIAGYETVASGMSWLWSLLAEHEDVQARLVAELREALGNGRPTYRQMSQLPILNGVIQEGFRLYPPSWLITRRSLAPDQIGGYDIPAGSLVVLCPYAIHRHPDFWPDGERFDIGRFLDGAEKAQHKYAYIPFGGGPHLCIGKPFAQLEAALTLGTLLPRFKLTHARPKPAVDPQVTIRPSDGLWMNLTRRD